MSTACCSDGLDEPIRKTGFWTRFELRSSPLPLQNLFFYILDPSSRSNLGPLDLEKEVTIFELAQGLYSYELEEMTAAVTINIPSMGTPCFRDFPDIRMVIECTDIFAERPSGLSASQQKFSSYKHHIARKK